MHEFQKAAMAPLLFAAEANQIMLRHPFNPISYSPAVRAWAAAQGIEVAAKGRVPAALRAAYDDAHRPG